MTKSLVVKLFWGSIIGLVAGLVLMSIACALAISNDIFIMSGPDVTGIKSGILPWTLLGLMGLAMLLLLFAAVVHSWPGSVPCSTQHSCRTRPGLWCCLSLVYWAWCSSPRWPMSSRARTR
jgi:hypothetical protein